MKILSIETSCDETAVAVLECSGGDGDASFKVLGNGLHSQSAIHAEYGGVFPAVAKRAHAENAVPMLMKALGDAGMLSEGTTPLPESFEDTLSREEGLAEKLRAFFASHARPDIDAVAITYGPGLEPALWVGVNFARALATTWNVPLIPVNHMEGHFLAGLGVEEDGGIRIRAVGLPVLGLLISGGHTELDLMKDWLSYDELGATRDDAVGEAFDKVARMLGLPYPGGPEISKRAEIDRAAGRTDAYAFPRPMASSDDYDFSFSGLKTAVLYALKGRDITELDREQVARAFEDAATEVLWTKTSKALDATLAKTLVIGGGVSANKHIGETFTKRIAEEHPGVELRIPARALTTDNAVMIGMAGYFRALRKEFADPSTLSANGTLSLAAR